MRFSLPLYCPCKITPHQIRLISLWSFFIILKKISDKYFLIAASFLTVVDGGKSMVLGVPGLWKEPLGPCPIIYGISKDKIRALPRPMKTGKYLYIIYMGRMGKQLLVGLTCCSGIFADQHGSGICLSPLFGDHIQTPRPALVRDTHREETILPEMHSVSSYDDALCVLRACGHVFHRQCIVPWAVRGNNRCPICRQLFFGDP